MSYNGQGNPFGGGFNQPSQPPQQQKTYLSAADISRINQQNGIFFQNFDQFLVFFVSKVGESVQRTAKSPKTGKDETFTVLSGQYGLYNPRLNKVAFIPKWLITGAERPKNSIITPGEFKRNHSPMEVEWKDSTSEQDLRATMNQIMTGQLQPQSQPQPYQQSVPSPQPMNQTDSFFNSMGNDFTTQMQPQSVKPQIVAIIDQFLATNFNNITGENVITGINGNFMNLWRQFKNEQ